MRRRWKRLELLLTLFGVALVSSFESSVAFQPLPLKHSLCFHVSTSSSHPIQSLRSNEATAGAVPFVTSASEPEPLLQNQKRQRRSPSTSFKFSTARKPRSYWKDISNVERELRTFWSQLSVNISESEPPPIPNESLLRRTERHNIRGAIVSHGGRELLSAQLGGARIIPGKWAEAVATSPELQQLLQPQRQLQHHRGPLNATASSGGEKEQLNPSNDLLLLPDLPPWSLPLTISTNETSFSESLKTWRQKRWCHHEGRNRRGYWTLQQVIQELYEYLDDYKIRHGRPSVWMPRPAEISASGRLDLRQSFTRFGGVSTIAQLAGLVTFREWNYFDGQYRMLVKLKQYLDEFHGRDYTIFPCASEMQRNGCDELYALIQYYGGRKFVASRLSMNFAKKTIYGSGTDDIQWGAFDLDFAIRLLHFVREDQMKQMPPMAKPVIAMPPRSKLLSTTEGQQLDQSISRYGGYENVARRLGLAFFY